MVVVGGRWGLWGGMGLRRMGTMLCLGGCDLVQVGWCRLLGGEEEGDGWGCWEGWWREGFVASWM